MKKIEVFDPAMCCSTGICGSSADEVLVTFASDLEWLKAQGIEVVRYGLSFDPAEFIKNEAVKDAICAQGSSSLPLVVVDSEVVFKSSYPSRAQLAKICKIEYNENDAPPVHREENCCCGVDCDCGHPKTSTEACEVLGCDCTNAAAEDNCYCPQNSPPPVAKDNSKLILVVLVLLAIAAIIGFKAINS